MISSKLKKGESLVIISRNGAVFEATITAIADDFCLFQMQDISPVNKVDEASPIKKRGRPAKAK